MIEKRLYKAPMRAVSLQRQVTPVKAWVEDGELHVLIGSDEKIPKAVVVERDLDFDPYKVKFVPKY